MSTESTNLDITNQGGWYFEPEILEVKLESTDFEYRRLQSSQLPQNICMTSHSYEQIREMKLLTRSSSRITLASYLEQVVKSEGINPRFALCFDDQPAEVSIGSVIVPLGKLGLSIFDEKEARLVHNHKDFLEQYAANWMIRNSKEWISLIDVNLSRAEIVSYAGSLPFIQSGNSMVGLIHLIDNLSLELTNEEFQRRIFRSQNYESSPINLDNKLSGHSENSRIPLNFVNQLIEHSKQNRETLINLMQRSPILSPFLSSPTLSKGLNLFIVSSLLSDDKNEFITHKHPDLKPEKLVAKIENIVQTMM